MGFEQAPTRPKVPHTRAFPSESWDPHIRWRKVGVGSQLSLGKEVGDKGQSSSPTYR